MKDINYYDKLEEIPFYLKDCYKRQKFLGRMADIIIFFIILSAVIRVYKDEIPITISSNIINQGLFLLIVVIFFMVLKTEQKKYAHFIESRKVSFVPKKHLIYLSSVPPVLDGYVLFLLVSTNVISFKNYIQYIVNKINSGEPTENIIESFVSKRLSNYGSYAYNQDGTVSQDFVNSFTAHHKLNNKYISENQRYKEENETFEDNLMDILLDNEYVFRRKGRILLTTSKSKEMASSIMAYVNYLYCENKLNTTEPYNTLFRE